MKLNKILLLAFFIVLSPLFLASKEVKAATYYVDATGGSDSSNGTSTSTAWQTLSKVNGSTFSAGDTINLKKGEMWREQLTPPSSGSSGSPITFDAYGSGNTPVINGSNLVTTWTSQSTGSEIDDNFDDNDEVSWTDSGGGTHAAASGREEITIVNGGSDAIYRTGTARSEYWGFQRLQLLSSGLTWVSGNSIQLILIGSSQSNRLGVDILNSSGTALWRARYQNDAGAQTSSTSVSISTDTYHSIVSHYKAATGVGANDGIAQIWIDGVEILNLTTVDSDTLTANSLKLGNSFASSGLNATIYIDDAKLSTGAVGLNFWSATLASTPSQLFFDGTRGSAVTAVGLISAANSWYYDSTNTTAWTYRTTDPDLLVTPGVEASIRNRTLLINSKNYINVKNLRFKQSKTGTEGGIYVNNSGNINLDTLTINDNEGYAGIYMEGSGSSNTIQNSTIYNTKHDTADRGDGIILDGSGGTHTIYNNTIYSNDGSGIRMALFTATSNNTITSNTIHHNGAAGISLNTSCANNIVEKNIVYTNIQSESDYYEIDLFKVGNNNVVRYNTVHDGGYVSTDAGGIRFDGAPGGVFGTGNTIYYNVIYNERQGIHLLDVDNANVYNNTIYNSTLYGLHPHGTSADSNVFRNNIVHTAGTYLAYNEDATNTSLNYNIYYPDASSAFKWNSTSASAFSGWKTNSSGETNSVSRDPAFANLSALNFRLGSSSPARNTGLNVGLTLDFDGKSVPQESLFDIGAFEYVQAAFDSSISQSEPSRPNLYKFQGGAVSSQNVLSIVQPNTFKWDSYLSVNGIPKTKAFKIGNTLYWQVSPMFDVWWKTFQGDTKILSDEVSKPFVLAITYSPSTIEKSLSEKNLKLAYSGDDRKTWKVLPNSVLDLKNKTVATVTKNGGWYMLVSRGVLTNANIAPVVKGVSIVATPVPTTVPEVVEPSREVVKTPETTSSKKKCIWFVCF